MSIMDLFEEIEQKGWKAGDSENDNLPDNLYEGVIEKVEFKTNDKGTQWFSFTVDVLKENRKYFANVYISGKMASVNLKKFINIVYNLTGEALTATDFANEIALAQSLSENLAGKEVALELKTNKGGFQNFNFVFDAS